MLRCQYCQEEEKRGGKGREREEGGRNWKMKLAPLTLPISVLCGVFPLIKPPQSEHVWAITENAHSSSEGACVGYHREYHLYTLVVLPSPTSENTFGSISCCEEQSHLKFGCFEQDVYVCWGVSRTSGAHWAGQVQPIFNGSPMHL